MHETILTVALAALVTAPTASAGASDHVPLSGECDLYASVNDASIRTGNVSFDLGTGEDGNVRHGYTTRDVDWNVIAPTPGHAYSVAPHTAWLPPTTANWINAKQTYDSSGTSGPVVVSHQLSTIDAFGPVIAALPSKTTFRTTFTIPKQSFLNRLDLSYAADNGVTFLLNGVTIGGYDPPVADPSAFQQERMLTYTGPQLRQGENHLDAVVTDYGVATGLLVRGGYRGCALTWVEPGICARIVGDTVVTYAPAPINLGTGEHDYVPDQYGAIDGKWTTVEPTPGPAYSVEPYPGWYKYSTISNWINATKDPRTTAGIEGGLGDVAIGIEDLISAQAAAAPGVPAPLTRRYKVEFEVGPNATYQDLDLRWAADNDVMFLLNGVTIGTFTGATTSHFRQLNPLRWVGAFKVGTNKLEAIVTDYGVATGLLVEGGARVCYREVES